MLKKGEEFIVVFVPLVVFFILWGGLFAVLGLEEVDYGLREWVSLSLLYLITYIIGYYVVLRKWHPSYLIPYIYGSIFWVYYFLSRVPVIESFGLKLVRFGVDILILLSYLWFRRFFFGKYNFDESHYNRKR